MAASSTILPALTAYTGMVANTCRTQAATRGVPLCFDEETGDLAVNTMAICQTVQRYDHDTKQVVDTVTQVTIDRAQPVIVYTIDDRPYRLPFPADAWRLMGVVAAAADWLNTNGYPPHDPGTGGAWERPVVDPIYTSGGTLACTYQGVRVRLPRPWRANQYDSPMGRWYVHAQPGITAALTHDTAAMLDTAVTALNITKDDIKLAVNDILDEFTANPDQPVRLTLATTWRYGDEHVCPTIRIDRLLRARAATFSPITAYLVGRITDVTFTQLDADWGDYAAVITYSLRDSQALGEVVHTLRSTLISEHGSWITAMSDDLMRHPDRFFAQVQDHPGVPDGWYLADPNRLTGQQASFIADGTRLPLLMMAPDDYDELSYQADRLAAHR